MDPREKPPREDRRRSRRENPSFSSTLLDQIYRSIDESDGVNDEVAFCRGTMKQKKKHLRDFIGGDGVERSHVVEKIVVHRRSIAADFERSRARRGADSAFFNNSSSSSSDSSGFSSLESDWFHGLSRSSGSPPAVRNSGSEIRQPKPIRTSVESFERSHQIHRSGAQKPNNNKHELGSFLRTKSRALKIYSDLKKVKQPISPGGKLASFLNSLFTAGNTNKPKKMKSTASSTTTEQAPSSTCSSASSFSRSCLSKTPSSSGKSKRSVRFCPVSVILDEDSRPCGHKKLNPNEGMQNPNHNYEELGFGVMEENCRVIEAAKDLLRNYRRKKEEFESLREIIGFKNCEDNEESADEDDEVDGESCASSDLFELDNLSAIRIERYREELPVYETTHLATNRAMHC